MAQKRVKTEWKKREGETVEKKQNRDKKRKNKIPVLPCVEV